MGSNPLTLSSSATLRKLFDVSGLNYEIEKTANEAASQIKALATHPDNLSLVPRTNMVEG